jgi:protein subunit release factor B
VNISGLAVTPAKVQELLRRIAALAIDLDAIEERFIRGGGRGGQKINKTSNCVQLRYAPLDIDIRCQEDRRRGVNRFLALRRLVDEIEFRVSPETSEKGRRILEIRARKARARRRSAKEEP